MVPILLDGGRVRFAIVGEGEAALRRLRFLRSHGAEPARIFAPAASVTLAEEAGDMLARRWPVADDLKDIHVVFAGDVSDDVARELAAAAAAAKALVNIEDELGACDYHVPATVRRGALLLTASTGGASPALARRVVGWLADRFGPEWAERISSLAAVRADWYAQGLPGDAVADATNRYIDEKGWLS